MRSLSSVPSAAGESSPVAQLRLDDAAWKTAPLTLVKGPALWPRLEIKESDSGEKSVNDQPVAPPDANGVRGGRRGERVHHGVTARDLQSHVDRVLRDAETKRRRAALVARHPLGRDRRARAELDAPARKRGTAT